ncbi:MAG: hypothetical protein WCT14_11645, partial [Treponemataceae bacterium]
MRVLRYLIILIGISFFIVPVLSPLLIISAERSSNASTTAMLTSGFGGTLLILLFLIVVQIACAVPYSKRVGASFAWTIGSVVLPAIVPLLLALRFKPKRKRRRSPNNPRKKTFSFFKPRSIGAAPIPALSAPSATSEKEIFPYPLREWKAGIAFAPILGDTWEKVADNFIATESSAEAPDFPALRKALEPFSAAERHDAWHKSGWKFRELGDPGTANLCFAEGLLAAPDPSSTDWGTLTYLPGSEETELRKTLSVFPAQATDENLSAAAKAARLLAGRFGVADDSASKTIFAYNEAVEALRSGDGEGAAEKLVSLFNDPEIGLSAFYLWGVAVESSGRE